MKKIFTTLLTILLLFCIITPIYAEDSAVYAYTIDEIEGFDNHVKENVGLALYAYYGYVDTDITLGNGIFINESSDYPKVLYPVWKRENIVGSYVVARNNGTYSGSYSEGHANVLNSIKEKVSIDNPLKLVKEQDYLYVVLGEEVYDIDGIPSERVDVEINANNEEELSIINIKESLVYDKLILSRAPTSFTNNFTVYHSNPSDDFNCYAYCLSNILRNLGYSKYTYTYVKNNCTNELGVTGGNMNVASIRNFLTNEGFSYGSSSSSYLSPSQVRTAIYSNDNYIMMGLRFTEKSGDHYAIMYGYASSGSATVYTLWDPRSSSGTRHTMESSSLKYTNTRLEELEWSKGYFINFNK